MSIEKIRNLILMLIVCNFGYFIFPFPPAIWRGLLILSFLIVIGRFKVCKFDVFQKSAFTFFVMISLYFAVALVCDKPEFGSYVDMSMTLLGMIAFSIMGQNNVLTRRFLLVSMIFCLAAAVIYYYNFQDVLTDMKGLSLDAMTNNASTCFLLLLPLSLIFYKEWYTTIVIAICVYFLLLGAKRGNIIAAALVLLLYLFLIFKEHEYKKSRKVLIIVALVGVSFLASNWILSNDYLLHRYEQTLNGDSSGRDIIYYSYWNQWKNNDSLINVFFGMGHDGTVKSSVGTRAHNDWLEFLVNYGLVGIFLYMPIFFSVGRYYYRCSNSMGRVLFASIIFIWTVKSVFSMFITNNVAILLAIPFGYAVQTFYHPETNKA